ncbi:MAG: TSUP family transporter [Alphaproteobacteria bacterium]|nr:TSUP family transporter [Alphaproteobacteria bacterium]
MPASIIAILLSATFATAAISGIFGMAGGLILMGVLVAFVPVATAMVMHGFIQIVSNLSRAALLRSHISWTLVGRYSLGVVAGVVLIAALLWRPSQPHVFLLLGMTAMLVWIPRSWLAISIENRFQAELCGFLVQTLNTLAGVAGPLLDLFFARSALSRQAVVATKAATQVLAHAAKILFWGLPLAATLGSPETTTAHRFPPVWLFAAIVPLSLVGTWLGGKVLERMTDANFREWTKWIVTATGAVYLGRGIAALAA